MNRKRVRLLSYSNKFLVFVVFNFISFKSYFYFKYFIKANKWSIENENYTNANNMRNEENVSVESISIESDEDVAAGNSRNYLENNLLEEKRAKSKFNDLQAKFSEISQDLDYTKLFDDHRDYEEIKLRNKKLENDLIHSNEKYLNELSKVRENFESQIKFRTTTLQNEIDELRQSKEEIDLVSSKKIDELVEVIETERDDQKNRIQDIISHFENILDRTSTFSLQLQNDFDSIQIKTTSLKKQAAELESNLRKEFADNLTNLRNQLPFVRDFDAGLLNTSRYSVVEDDNLNSIQNQQTLPKFVSKKNPKRCVKFLPQGLS